ncbi:hypothetical protein [Mycolicibacterium palauense]|uniref:hypothetical protein n=1 Tax=Mycolicibacterium palauense TaxID=2034511 RepID=UPI000BFECC65|nr:hypothetical protein [Mycolicibacterium palauense]
MSSGDTAVGVNPTVGQGEAVSSLGYVVTGGVVTGYAVSGDGVTGDAATGMSSLQVRDGSGAVPQTA